MDTVTELLESIQEDVDTGDYEAALQNVATLQQVLESLQEKGAE